MCVAGGMVEKWARWGTMGAALFAEVVADATVIR